MVRDHVHTHGNMDGIDDQPPTMTDKASERTTIEVLKETLCEAVIAVLRLLAKRGPSLQRGAYGCLAWNAQLAHCVGHRFGNAERNLMADALQADPGGTVTQLVDAVLKVSLDEIKGGLGTLSKFQTTQSRVVWFFSDGFDRFCQIIHATACSAEPFREDTPALQSIQDALSEQLMSLMFHDEVGTSVLQQMKALRLSRGSSTDVIMPEEMIVWRNAPDAHVRHLVRDSTTSLTILQFMETHLRGSGLRDACKIDSIFPEESTSTADLLDASCRFARLALRDTDGDLLVDSWRIKLLVAALDGVEESWVVRGAVSSSAEALTGWFASRGQRPASVAYWRMIGWRLDDASAKAFCRRVKSQLRQLTPDLLHRLTQMCLFCPTRLSIWMLVEYEHTSLLEHALLQWMQAGHRSETLDPLMCFGRRLGGTVSFAYTISPASAGLDEDVWERLHAYEDEIRFNIKEPLPKSSMVSEEVEKGSKEVDLVGRLYQELHRALTTHLVPCLQSSMCQWMLMCNGLSTYDRHEAEYVQVCLRASIDVQAMRLISPPYVEGLSPLCNAPAYLYYPTCSCAEMCELRTDPNTITSTHILKTLNAESTRDTATRLMHRVAQNVAYLIDQSLALRLRHSESGEESSPLHSSRHAAVVVLMPALATDAPPVLFARFLTSTTMESFPPSISSDVLLDAVEEATSASVSPGPVGSAAAAPSLPLSVLNKEDEARINQQRLAGGAVLASKFALCMQDAAFVRHKRIRREAEHLHAARIALHTQQGRRQTMRVLAAQYNAQPEHVEQLLTHAHHSMQQDALPPTNSTDSTDSTEEAHKHFDVALQKLMQNGLLDRQVLQKGQKELREATPYTLDTWDERMAFAKRMQEQRRCLQGTAYDAASEHVIGIIAAARDEWITRGTHTVQGNVDPECGLIPMLVTWETRATDLHRLSGDEALRAVRDLERRHLANVSKLAAHGTSKTDTNMEKTTAFMKDALRASIRAEHTPGLVQSIE